MNKFVRYSYIISFVLALFVVASGIHNKDGFLVFFGIFVSAALYCIWKLERKKR